MKNNKENIRRDRPACLLLVASTSSAITSCNGQTWTKEMGVSGCTQKVKSDTEGKGLKPF